MPLLSKTTPAGPGSSSVNQKDGGVCEGWGEGENSKSVEMDSLRVRTITQSLQLFTRLNFPKHFTSMFPFFFSVFIPCSFSIIHSHS